MVVIKVNYDTGILPIFRSKTGFAIISDWMMVSEIINCPVEFDPFFDLFRVIILLISFYKIGNKVSDHQLFIVSGKKNVGKKVQLYKVLREWNMQK